MNYTITLIVSLIILIFGIVSFYIYRLIYEKQSRRMLSGVSKKIKLPKLRVVKNLFIIFALVMIVPVFLIDTWFIPRNNCSSVYENRSVNKWESRLNVDSAYKMCFCAEGYPVFRDPNTAFLRIFLDNPKGLLHQISLLHVPLTRLNYELFRNFQNGGNYLTADPTVLAQVERIKLILGIYENSYNRYLVPIDENGDQTTMNGVLNFEIESYKILNYAFLENGNKIESEDGYSYLYVYFSIENLTKNPYAVNQDSISIVGESGDREVISTVDINNIDKSITGVIDAGSVKKGLIIVKVDDAVSNILKYLDKRISIKTFEFKIE
jgi:hypothetical protein